jgi:hypothetical protein
MSRPCTGAAPAPVRSATRAGTGRAEARDRGAVTIEAALALCGLVLVATLAIGAVAAVAASVRCTDAARELVRLAARGEPDRGRAVAARLAPAGALVELAISGDEAVAEVRAAPVQLLPVHVVGRAMAVLEPAAVLAGTAGPGPAGAEPGVSAPSGDTGPSGDAGPERGGVP